MHDFDHLLHPPRLFRRILCLGVVLILFLTQAIQVSAGSFAVIKRDARTSGALTYNLPISSPPVAVDDSGDGFTTDENKPFHTQNVLLNDYDMDGDNLILAGFDASNTIGILDRVDGVLDLTFGQGGVAITDIDWYDKTTDLAVQQDGKIVLVGYSYAMDFVVIRYNLDGSLDLSFDSDGIVFTDLGGLERTFGVAIQPDNKIVVTGKAGIDNLGLVRYNSDGSLDLSFSSDGKVVVTGFELELTSYMGISLQPDGKIIVIGTTKESYYYSMIVVRLNPDGSLDNSFGAGGIVKTVIGNDTYGYDVAVQSDGRIMVSGYGVVDEPFEKDIVLVRYLPDGSLDPSFSDDGFLQVFVGETLSKSLGNALALQPDQKILVTGTTNDYFVLLRYNPDGTPDTTFGNDGISIVDLFYGVDLVVQSDGKIIATGDSYFYDPIHEDIGVIRLNEDGALDITFGEGGLVVININNDQGAAVGLGVNGVIDIGGTSENDFLVGQIIGYGSFSYNPNNQFNYLRLGEQAEDQFTYVTSDGVYTDTAAVTITISGVADRIYLPLLIDRPGIYGHVTVNGTPAEGRFISLELYDQGSWNVFDTTHTDSNGYYFFTNLPSLEEGQQYVVHFHNQGYAFHVMDWYTRTISDFNRSSSINMGSFDISTVHLINPPGYPEVSLPGIFRWQPRALALNDSYEFHLYDQDMDPHFYSDPLPGYVNSFTLTNLPPGFVFDGWYYWTIWIYSPDGGHGIAFDEYVLTFVNP